MPTKRTYIRRPHRTRLTGERELDLWLGPRSDQPPAFASDEQRRELWFQHRDRLMLLVAGHGHRPLAWWRYEAGDLRYPGYDRERSTLYQAGLLAEAERAELLAYWRHEFDRACRPDFFCCAREKILRGAPARRVHYRWADIPRLLVSEWGAERRRSTARIRKLQVEASGPVAPEPGA